MNWTDWLVYDEASPSGLRWKVDIFTGKKYKILLVAAGEVAGSQDADGYYRVQVNKKLERAHRIVYEMHNGPIPAGFEVDHKDGIRAGNSDSNLRLVSTAVNARNRFKSKANSSGKTGVALDMKHHSPRWIAFWQDTDGKRRSRRFAIAKYGYEGAYSLACEARDSTIALLNSQGAGYSERHGKDILCA